MMDEKTEQYRDNLPREDYWDAWVKMKIKSNDYRLIVEKLLELEIKAKNAEIDKLTGLLNRRGVETALEKLDEMMGRLDKKMVVVFMDLDGLKKINDIGGHSAGDKYIIKAAESLRASRTSDLIGRWGADEFIAVFTLTNEEGALKAVGRIQEELEDRGVAASIGVARNKSGISTIDLIEEADKAMVEAKNSGLRPGERSGGVGVFTIDI